jgi:hypothetical protein
MTQPHLPDAGRLSDQELLAALREALDAGWDGTARTGVLRGHHDAPGLEPLAGVDPGPVPSEKILAAARAAFAWRTVDQELALLLSGGVGVARPPAQRRRRRRGRGWRAAGRGSRPSGRR